MTVIYFVRHAEPDYNIHDDLTRPLTSKGKMDIELVNNYLENKQIDVMISSPFLRAIETINDFAKKINKNIHIEDDFRERKIDSCWIEDFNKFSMKQWNNFDYKLNNGECLREVQQRNINALKNILIEYENQNIVIGSHGTALCTIINYYDKSFGYDNFNEIKTLMPWIVKLTFNSKHCVGIEKINLFTL